MKTKALRKKLVLNKETVADLDIGKMKGIHGGENPPDTKICVETEIPCPMTVCTCGPSLPLPYVCACNSVNDKE
jgi:hypothetical protein